MKDETTSFGDAPGTLGKLRQAEADLQHVEGKYRWIFDSVGISLCEFDFGQVASLLDNLRAQGVSNVRQHFAQYPALAREALRKVALRDANPRALRLFGAQTKAQLQNGLAQVFGPESEAAFGELLAALAEGHTHWEGETALRTLAGQHRAVLLTVTLPEESSTYDHVLFSLHDVTRRTEAEQALRESEARFRLTADMAPVMMWTTDAEGRRDYSSRPWLDFTGRTLEQAAGQGWAEAIHPDDYQRCMDTCLEAQRARRKYEVEYRLRRADGTYRWVVETGVPRFGPGESFAGYAGTCTDIHERKQVEQWHRLMAEAAHALAAPTDFAGRLQALADLVVPALAHWCAVNIRQEDGTIRLVAAAHADPARTKEIFALAQDHPVGPDDASGTALVLRTGQAELWASDPPAPFPAYNGEQKRMERLKALGFASSLIVPLVGRGNLLGTLTLAQADPTRPYGPNDLALAEDLAARAAVEIDNARLYEEERRTRADAQRATQRMGRLEAAAAAFSRALTPEQVAEVIVRQGDWLVGTKTGDVLLFAYGATGVDSEADSGQPPLWRALPANVAQEAAREPVWAESLEVLRRDHPALAEVLPPDVPGALAFLPLTIEGRLMGIMAVRFGEAREFDAEKREFMLALAGLCAQALDRARLYRAEQRARSEAQALNTRLEERVTLRTKQLLDANASLEREVAERVQAEARLHASQVQLRNLAARLQNVREAERARYAYEIHDEFGQTMTALKMDVAWLHRNLGQIEIQALREKAANALEQIDTAIQTVRRIAADMRPGILDDLGLAAAIEWQAHEFEKRTGIRTKLSASAEALPLDAESGTAAFRIFQEILSNVRRHALASRVVITLRESEGEVVLAVRDNGRSITPEQIASPESLGLISIRELAQARGGQIEITGKPGKGTMVTLRLPRQKGQEQ